MAKFPVSMSIIHFLCNDISFGVRYPLLNSALWWMHE